MSIRYKALVIFGILLSILIVSGVSITHSLDKAKEDANLIVVLGRQRMLSQLMGKAAFGYTMFKGKKATIEQNIDFLDRYIESMRKLYTEMVFSPANEAGIKMSMNPKQEPSPSIPFPATFSRLINQQFIKSPNLHVDIISRNPVNLEQGLKTETDKQAYDFLLSNTVSKFEHVAQNKNGSTFSVYIKDKATTKECASCHSVLKNEDVNVGDLLGVRKYQINLPNISAFGQNEANIALEEYIHAKNIFNRTLSAFQEGGEYPIDLEGKRFAVISAIQNQNFQNKVNEIQKFFSNFQEDVNTLVDSKTNFYDFKKSGFNILNGVNILQAKSHELVEIYNKIANQNQVNIRTAIEISFSVIFLVLVFSSYYIFRFIVKPVVAVSNNLAQVSKGEFRQRDIIVNSNDELKDLALSTNQLTNNLQTFLLFASKMLSGESFYPNHQLTGQYRTALDKILNQAKSLKKLKENAERSNNAKSKFLSQMSHELRTPLNAILGFCQVLEADRKDHLSTKQRSNLNYIKKAGTHLLSLINEILDLSRIESGKMTVSLEPVEIFSIMEEALSGIAPMAEQYEMALKNKITKIPKVFIIADRTRFKQVLLNLISNAIKYNRKNGRVTISGFIEKDEKYSITVADTGFGIPKEKMDKLFEPFNRLGAEGSEIEGTGIGLTICKQLIELMNGLISVKSDNQGSSFTISLPLSNISTSEISKKENIEDVSETELNEAIEEQMTILYIEDNPANLALIEEILTSKTKIKLLSAPNAHIGLELARTRIPNLILMDINLPEMNGLEAYKHLQSYEETQHIPVIAMSANAMDSDVKQALEIGFHSYIVKPIRVNIFLQQIREVLAGIAADS